jgi:hypothetical protein
MENGLVIDRKVYILFQMKQIDQWVLWALSTYLSFLFEYWVFLNDENLKGHKAHGLKPWNFEIPMKLLVFKLKWIDNFHCEMFFWKPLTHLHHVNETINFAST